MTENRGLFTTDNAQAYLAVEPPMEVEKLSDRLWSISDGLYRTIFLEGSKSVVAFDTFGTPGRARAYRRKVAETIPGKEIGHVIYSHDHLDHAGFADDLAPNAEIIADEMCAKVISLRRAQGQCVPATVIAGARNEISIDGIDLVLLNPGPTHGTGNLAAWFQEEKALFSSDTILPNARYGLMPDCHICNFVKFMRGFLDLDWDTFIPGRYDITTRARFQKGCDYIEAVQEETQKAFVEFVPIWVMDAMAEYVAKNLKERFGDLDGFEEHIGLTSIRVVHHYLMGGWGLEDTPEPALILADEIDA